MLNMISPLIAFILMGFFHMNASQVDGGTALQPVQIESEDGFVNLGLPIITLKRLQDPDFDGLIIQSVGSFNGVPIGILIAIPDVWDQGTYDDGKPSPNWLGAVNIIRFGAASDDLIESLEELYKIPTTKHRARDSVVAPAVSLGEKPDLNSKIPVYLKAFFESNNDENYGELYINIIFSENILWLKEKNTEYRSAIVKALKTDGQETP